MSATVLPATGEPAPASAPGVGGGRASDWLPCSDRSRERDDPLAATGGRGLQWFLVEYEGAWGTRALLDPPFDVELGAALVRRIESAGMRPLAIRRTGRHPERVERVERPESVGSAGGIDRVEHLDHVDHVEESERVEPVERPESVGSVDGIEHVEQPARAVSVDRVNRAARASGSRGAQQRWRWAFVDSRLGHETVRWGEVSSPRELLDVPLDGSTGTASDRPVFAVCAHGRHDQCCAVRGRQVVKRLAEAYPEETWECSHLGGDRFAGTMVLFPHGLYYGRVDDGDAARIAASYLDGRIEEQWFRGRSSLTHPVQAAQHFARLEYGDERLDAYAPLGEEWHDGGDGHARWTVQLHDDAGTVTVELAEAHSEPLLSTCAATRPGRVRQWELVSLTR